MEPGPAVVVDEDEIRALEGKALRRLRDDAELTQEELEERSGIDKKQISRYESGRTMPGARNLARLLNAVGATAHDHALALEAVARETHGTIAEDGSLPSRAHIIGPSRHQDEPIQIRFKELSISVPPEHMSITIPEGRGPRRRRENPPS